MAKASFYVNDIRVRRKGEFLVLQARKKCQHGTVFDEISLTMPGELAVFFKMIEQEDTPPVQQDMKYSDLLSERLKRFLGDN